MNERIRIGVDVGGTFTDFVVVDEARDLIYTGKRLTSADDPSVAKGLPEGVGVGDPDHLVATIKRWESIGVTGINFLLNAMEMVPQEQVLESMRLFATEVMPQFREPTRQTEVYSPAGRPAFSSAAAGS